MRTVILGCGYLGTALAVTLRARGWPVAALTRNRARAKELRSLGVKPVVCADLASDAWHGELNPADASVVNCVSPSAPSPAGYRHSFIAGAASMVRWLEKSAAAGRLPARELVFTSATSVYPQTDGGWVEEDSAVDKQALSPAGEILRAAENLYLNISPRLTRRSWVLRLAGIYGPGRHQLLDKLRSGEAVPVAEARWLNLIHRDDAVAAIRACLAAATTLPGGVYNVADGQPVFQCDLLAWLVRQLHLDPASIHCDGSKPTRSRHRRLAEGGIPNRRVSNQRLRQLLGWKPVFPSYRDGYEQILNENV